MAGHSHLRLPAEEPGDFAQKSLPIANLAKGAAVIGIIGAIGLSFLASDAIQQFFFAYLTGLSYFMAICLGALFFVLIHHCTRAGWSVNVRRIAENMAAMLPVLGALSVPIFFAVLMQRGDLYRWAVTSSTAVEEHAAEKHSAGEIKQSDSGKPEATTEDNEIDPGRGNRRVDELMIKKSAWLNPGFFCVRLVAYFALWSLIAMYFHGQSTRQDVDGDYRHTVSMQKFSAPSLVVYGLSVTLAAWDMFMSLDPHWYSTMFGVYYFAGGVQSFFAAIIVIAALMHRGGFLKEAVTKEHYHDLGKYLFAFTFFFGYITFSQYMLQWYASLPDELGWPARHGMSTAHDLTYLGKNWYWASLTVLFGAILIPFAGLLSRHVKRKLPVLVFWAVWLLIFQFVNQMWVILPEMRHKEFSFVPMIAAVSAGLFVGGVLIAVFIRLTARQKLRPVNDPRMSESAAFVNF